MGVQRIQETSTASYGKSVEAAAAGNSSAAGSGSATGGTTQTVENKLIRKHTIRKQSLASTMPRTAL